MIIKWQSRNITMHKFITPRVGSDVTLIILTLITTKFQSTLPVWGATPMQIPLPVRPIDFNPRSPCGEQPVFTGGASSRMEFQSTLPVWGATHMGLVRIARDGISIHAPRVGSDSPAGGIVPGQKGISIHAPRVGSDQGKQVWQIHRHDFNPRSPCGERRYSGAML